MSEMKLEYDGEPGVVSFQIGNMFPARASWNRLSKRSKLCQSRTFCCQKANSCKGNGEEKAKSDLSNYNEAYKRLDKLDFMSAAKILFTDPPKKKKFGIDFHLVQLFFACMPSLAVYVVAQYARYEMRRMEAELEQKKKLEEEKAKETEQNETEEKETESVPELQDVKKRLDKLEEAVKEIVVESKKQTGASVTKNTEGVQDNKHPSKTVEKGAESSGQDGKGPKT